MDLQALGDRIAIRDVIDRYSDAVTRRDWPNVGATFHDDAVWSVGGGFNLEYRSRENIEAGLLIRGGTAPVRVAEHVDTLRSTGNLTRLT